MKNGSLLLSLVASLLFINPAYATLSASPVVRSGDTLVLIESVGTVSVEPDYVSVSAGVVTTADTAREAVDDNNKKMIAVLQAVKDEGIQPSKVETVDFDVDPVFADNDETEIIGCKAENSIKIELRDFDKAENTISALFDAGANSVSGFRFNVDDETYRSAARRAESAALADAQAQAESIASQLGLSVSRVLRVSNREIDFDKTYGKRSGGFIVVTGSRIASTPIRAGEIDFSVELYVEYALVRQ